MGRKLLAVCTAFALLFSMCSTALANSGDVRETSFFTEQPHTELDFGEMAYQCVDTKSILAEMDQLRTLLDDSANAQAVQERFDTLSNLCLQAKTMYALAEIYSYQDASNERAENDLEEAKDALSVLSKAFPLLMQDVLSSPCGTFLRSRLGESTADYYANYHPAPKKQQELFREENALENEYLRNVIRPCTVEYFGREWNMQSLNQAFYQDASIDEDTYFEVYGMLAQEQNDSLGGLYLRLVKLRRNTAAVYGYSNYGDYAYRYVYQRDYSPADAAAFREDVKTYIAPLNLALQALPYRKNSVCYDDYSGDIALDMMEPYIGQMSSELLESFTYMREHHLYDTAESDTKPDTGFTTTLPSYGAPFLFNAPAHDLFDFTTAVHEFGHYNNAYWSPCGWLDGTKSQDITEVHSQGLELLFSHYYPDIFGKDSGDVLDYQTASLVSAICEGAYYDELQQYVYSNSGVTIEQINAEARRLSIAYGFAEEDSPMADIYGLNWVQISHNFISPFYYISYAVSAAGAFAFWLDAQKDYFSAVDSYLAYTALDASYGFQESFAAAGLSSPLASGYLKTLSQSLQQELRIDEKLEAIRSATAFTDVSADSWYAHYVLSLAELGCIDGDENGAFHPDNPAAWDTAMGALLGLTGQRPELEDSRTVTRQEFCQMIVKVLDIPAAKEPSPFSDTRDSAVAALAELGAVSGYSDGTFRPEETLTRVGLCAILYKAAAAVNLLEPEETETAGELAEAA